MLLELVSGRKKRRKTKQEPESHMSSQRGHCQSLLSAAKPPVRGPKAGPRTAEIPQIAIP